MLYTIIIKAHMKAFDETTELTFEEETFLYNYLFNTEIWGKHELSLFSICSTLLSPELFTMYARECLRKTDFLGELDENRKIIHTMLLNGLCFALMKMILLMLIILTNKSKIIFTKKAKHITVRFIYGQRACLITSKGINKMD